MMVDNQFIDDVMMMMMMMVMMMMLIMRVDRQLVRMGYRLLVRGCKGL